METANNPHDDAKVDYFDHNSAEYSQHRFDWFRAIRLEFGPVFWTPHYGGFWVVIGWEELSEAAKNWEMFSSRGFTTGKSPDRPAPEGSDIDYNGLFIPPRERSSRLLEDDPPEWTVARRTMQPLFNPPAVAKWQDRIQRLVDACIDRRIESGRIDFAKDLSDIVPVIFSMELAGLPTKEYLPISEFHHLTSHMTSDDPRWKDLEAVAQLQERLTLEAIANTQAMKKQDRPNTVIGHLVTAREEGASFSDEDIVALAALTLGGGIDTTAAMLGTTFVMLSEKPALKQKLLDNPDIIPSAFDEFMRIATPTQGLCRTATQDTVLGGQKIKKGERVMLCFGAANRDPREFDAPENVVLDRKPNRHVGFGSGNHRCIGAHFAKLEFEIIMQTLIRRMPDFRVDVAAAKSYNHVGIVAGWITVPATFTPGPRIGADPGVLGWQFDK